MGTSPEARLRLHHLSLLSHQLSQPSIMIFITYYINIYTWIYNINVWICYIYIYIYGVYIYIYEWYMYIYIFLNDICIYIIYIYIYICVYGSESLMDCCMLLIHTLPRGLGKTSWGSTTSDRGTSGICWHLQRNRPRAAEIQERNVFFVMSGSVSSSSYYHSFLYSFQ